MLAKCWLGVVVMALVACGGKSEGVSAASSGAAAGSNNPSASSLSACDPLAGITTTMKLAASAVVAAGRAKDGTLYVIYSDDRLFVGSDQSLTERIVIGSGSDGSRTDLDYTDDDGAQVTVEVAGKQMLVAHGAQKSKGIDDGNGESLTPVDAALVAKISTTTTTTFQIDFAASLADGRELVVVAPAHDVDFEQFRAFFGAPTALAQRGLTNFGSTQGGQRYATVGIDGAPADLTYLAGGPSAINPNGGPSTLTIAGTVYLLTEGPVPTDASYLCLPN